MNRHSPRPARPARLGLTTLASVLLLATMAGTALGEGSAASPAPSDGQQAMPGTIPHGGASVLAFGSFGKEDGHGAVYTIRADGTDRRFIARGFDPVWSPDGSMIAYLDFPFETPGNGGWNVMIADAHGTRVLVEGIGCFGVGHGVHWSPDGRFVAYPRSRTHGCDDKDQTGRDLMVVPADGSATPRQLLAEPLARQEFAWSPRGDRIAFETEDEGVRGIWVADVPDPSAPFDLVAHPLSKPADYAPGSWGSPRWSPDGSTIATSRAAPGEDAWDVVLLATDGSSETVVWPGPEDSANPSWSPDGTRLLIQRHHGPGGAESDPYDLYLVDPDGSNPTLVQSPPLSGWLEPYPFSPDGTMIVGQSPTSTDDKGAQDTEFDHVVTLDGSVEPLRIYAPNVSVATWQPQVNAESPLAWARPDMTYSAPASPTP